jgi:hypothetical protein
MILSIIVVGVQLLVLVGTLVREWGEDDRFEGDKLKYRS